MSNKSWAYWRLAAFLVIVLLTTLGFRETSARSDADRQSRQDLRNQSVTFCQDGNDRTATLKDLMNSLIRPPRPEDVAFIPDAKLREGAYNQALARYQENKAKVDAFGKPRDCERL